MPIPWPDHQFGWKKDKFNEYAWIHEVGRVSVPNVKILDSLLPTVRDQGNAGSCVGFGIGANLVSCAKKLYVYTEWFSPTWIYNGARYLDGSLAYDGGCYPEDALDWLKQKGCLLEHFWPYNGFEKTSPPSSLNVEAAKYPLLSYYRVTNDIDGICDAIAKDNYVSIGTPWFDTWLDIGSTGKLPEVTVSTNVVGGHETCLYGYDRTTQLFYGINSWGKAWGADGLYRMPFSAIPIFKKMGGYDAHYVKVTWAEQPVPEPDDDEDDGFCHNLMAKLMRLSG